MQSTENSKNKSVYKMQKQKYLNFIHRLYFINFNKLIKALIYKRF
jgi:hypothetical protein